MPDRDIQSDDSPPQMSPNSQIQLFLRIQKIENDLSQNRTMVGVELGKIHVHNQEIAAQLREISQGLLGDFKGNPGALRQITMIAEKAVALEAGLAKVDVRVVDLEKADETRTRAEANTAGANSEKDKNQRKLMWGIPIVITLVLKGLELMSKWVIDHKP